MKNLINYIIEALKINSKSKVNQYNYQPKDLTELKIIVYKLIKDRGKEADLNDINVSKITNMYNLFNNQKFDGDISQWDVSNVENMEGMFAYSEFSGKNGDISNWNVSKLKNKKCIFFDAPIAYNPPKWYK